jgi:lipocalin-like protein
MKTLMCTPQSEVLGLERSSYANRLIGVWRLVKYTDEHEDSGLTQPFGLNPLGFLIYTVDGFVSAQLMKPGRPAFHSADWHHGTPQEYEASGSGYIAYCGTYEVDEEKATVTHIPSVSLLPNLIQGRQCRSIELPGDRLVLRAAGVPVAGGLNVISRLEWKRITSQVTPSI